MFALLNSKFIHVIRSNERKTCVNALLATFSSQSSEVLIKMFALLNSTSSVNLDKLGQVSIIHRSLPGVKTTASQRKFLLTI